MRIFFLTIAAVIGLHVLVVYLFNFLMYLQA